MKYNAYEASVRRSLWAWADRHHRDELDSGGRQKRPPVLDKRFVAANILVPEDKARARKVIAAIPGPQRHRWFGSLKSSQALTQSVFGAIRAFDRLDLLKDVSADCGMPAFFPDLKGVRLDFEQEPGCLGEPRPTSIDVLLHGLAGKVAIECKFTEREFGMCSRPNLKPGDKTYPQQHCDGSYRVQHGRRERCALSEIGVQYWRYLPGLFDWPADRDHLLCPLRNVYQLGRNALAATVTPKGTVDTSGRHVLVVYDARNPEFLPNGKAGRQWEAAIEACRVSGLLRRVSWQRLLTAAAGARELSYLVEALEEKYGLKPA